MSTTFAFAEPRPQGRKIERLEKTGNVVKYGTSGCVRVDVVHGNPKAPTAISDLKTGGAKLTPSREAAIRKQLPKPNQTIPIKEERLPPRK